MKCRATLALRDVVVHCSRPRHNPGCHWNTTYEIEWADRTPGATPHREPSLWDKAREHLKQAWDRGHSEYVILVQFGLWDEFIKAVSDSNLEILYPVISDKHGYTVHIETDFGQVRCLQTSLQADGPSIQVRSWGRR